MSEVMKKYDLSFKPIEPTGKGRGRVFSYSEDQWKELAAAAANVTGDDRKELCEAYFVGYQTILKKAGVVTAPQSKKKASARSSSPAARQPSVFDQLEALSENAEGALAELDREVERLKEQLAEIEKKKKMLKKLSELTAD